MSDTMPDSLKMSNKLTVEVLMKPIIPLLEDRLKEILLMAYDAGHLEGKKSEYIKRKGK
jgi:hypothetical protein